MQGSQNKNSLHAQLQTVFFEFILQGKTLVNESRRAPLGQDQGTRCCSMSKQLQQHLDRLQHEHPVVRRHAVAGVFQLLAQHSMYASKHGQDALQACLRQTHQVTNRAFVGKYVPYARHITACINPPDHGLTEQCVQHPAFAYRMCWKRPCCSCKPSCHSLVTCTVVYLVFHEFANISACMFCLLYIFIQRLICAHTLSRVL